MQNPTSSILALVYAVPDDSAFHKVSPGVEARTRADGNFVVSVHAEYVNGDPNLGYVDGCPAALLALETTPSTLLDTGSDGPGVEWWVLRAPTTPVYDVVSERVHPKTGVSLGRGQSVMNDTPMTHTEACTFLSKFTPRRGGRGADAWAVRYMLVPRG